MTKVETITKELIKIVDQVSKEALIELLKRPNNVRVAKIANFHVSGVKLNQIFDTEDLYEITNSIYDYVELKIDPHSNGIEDPELLKKLQG